MQIFFLQEKKAKELTELVDKAGRAIVKVGDYKECRKIVSIYYIEMEFQFQEKKN